MAQEVTVVFDIGKTNKKSFVFDKKLNIIHHENTSFDEITDDDGFSCEDLSLLVKWIRKSIADIAANDKYQIKYLNFSTYGASLVHLDKDDNLATPFYNYLKEYPTEVLSNFFEKYGDKDEFATATASPVMGFLNSGLQLYYLKHYKPDLFKKIDRTFHFPQYLSYLFTGKHTTGYASLGCHTSLWNYKEHQYHQWVKEENIDTLLTAPLPATTTFKAEINGHMTNVGIGMHDSSAALESYLYDDVKPFVLISTGTWSICMNFFNNSPITTGDFNQDCLNYLSSDGLPVKASRLYLGQYMIDRAKLLSDFFNTDDQKFKSIRWNQKFISKRTERNQLLFNLELLKPERFGYINNSAPDYAIFDGYEDAYYHLMDEMTDLQIASLRLTIDYGDRIKNIYIDGGFASNEVFVQMLKNKLPIYEIKHAPTAIGSALGAAMVITQQKGDAN